MLSSELVDELEELAGREEIDWVLDLPAEDEPDEEVDMRDVPATAAAEGSAGGARV